MERLASLATRRPWRVIALTVVFLAISVVVGGSLTSSLTSGGFEDKGAEFYKARQSLEAATGATPQPGLVALVEPGGGVRTGEGRAAVAADRRDGGQGPRRGPGRHRLQRRRRRPDLEGRRLLLPGGLLQAHRRRRRRRRGLPHRGLPGERPPGAPGRRRRGGGARGHHHRRGPRAGRDARLPDPLPALAAVLPQRGRGAAAAADRRPWRSSAPSWRSRIANEAIDPLDLRAQPRHRPRPGPRDRLQPVHRLPLPGGDRRHGPGPRRPCGAPCAPRAGRCSSARSRSPPRSPR